MIMTLLGLLIIAWALTPSERPYSNHAGYYDEEPWPMTSAEEREFWLASTQPLFV